MQPFPGFRPCANLILCAFLACLLTACREKLPYNVAGVGLPDLADHPAEVAPPKEQRDGIAESITFPSGTPGLYDKYIEWLTRKGWTRLSETQEVSLLRSIMVKDNTQLIVVFAPRTGLNISGVRPATTTPAEDAATTADQ